MSRIRSKNTKPEIAIRKILHSRGFRFRVHRKDLPGKPDIVLSKYNAVIFVHGCFWHGHADCKHFVVPKTRTEWWLSKINRNKKLDAINTAKLQEMGWKVIEIYECELKKTVVEKMVEWLVKELRK